jgi:hypothetical protein
MNDILFFRSLTRSRSARSCAASSAGVPLNLEFLITLCSLGVSVITSCLLCSTWLQSGVCSRLLAAPAAGPDKTGSITSSTIPCLRRIAATTSTDKEWCWKFELWCAQRLATGALALRTPSTSSRVGRIQLRTTLARRGCSLDDTNKCSFRQA